MVKLNFTTHSGKMKGIPSLSTSCLCNARCVKRSKVDGSICSHCYSAAYLSFRKTLRDNLEANYKTLQTLIPIEEMPVINACFFRIESFGDVASVNHARNYVRLAVRNPRVNFGVWTKNLDYYRKAFALEGGKPENLILIVSSPMLNKVVKIAEQDKTIVDHRFTVVDKKSTAEINCGARSCLTCQKCYQNDTAFDIVERLK